MRIEIPELCVVALVGVSGSGKSTFAKAHFASTEILSSDYFRALVSDDENDQSVSSAAFETLYYVANKRLDLGRLCVIDATNVQKEARAQLLQLAKDQNCLAVAVVLDMPEKLCRARNEVRPDRNFGGHVIVRQGEQLRRSIRFLEKEGFRYVYVLKSEEEAAGAEVVRVPLWNNKKDERGPFDIIGDIHGCYEELCELLGELGYSVDAERFCAIPPGGRKAVFLGDLCDRGPQNMAVLKLVMNMVREGHAYSVIGNHDAKLLKKLRGADVQLSHGLDKTVGELAAEPPEFVLEVKEFLDSLVSHYVFDRGRLVVAHAGLKEKMHGRSSGKVRNFCLYGDTTGETDEYGLPVRLDWANEYRGRALVVYGHTPQPDVRDVNNTWCIDTGCVFGGKLTAMQYPEKRVLQVDAKHMYYAPAKPFLEPSEERDDLIDIGDVSGQRFVDTRLRRTVRIDAEYAAAALEVMSRFAADPHWLIYLPPTMSPCETSKLEDYLEHPLEAFEYYKSRGVGRVILEQKHMGSRAVIVLAKDAAAAAKRFGVCDGSEGIIYTRTGRHFFEDAGIERALLARLQAALADSGFWKDFETDWVCLDTELMPWSAKARKLIEEQYAPVGRAGRSGLELSAKAVGDALRALGDRAGGGRGESNETVDLNELLAALNRRRDALERYTDAYRAYCWNVAGVDDYRIAPFHVLATEGNVWSSNNHLWHMETIAKYMTAGDPVFVATEHMVVDVLDENSIAAGVAWWEALTASGGEGMVVKPYEFIPARGRELLQPAVKCRGREYLRIIYGPEYMLGENLNRLKKRSLSKKRGLALDEFALGMEALERFVGREALHRVHECVFGVLALESEPVDPRL